MDVNNDAISFRVLQMVLKVKGYGIAIVQINGTSQRVKSSSSLARYTLEDHYIDECKCVCTTQVSSILSMTSSILANVMPCIYYHLPIVRCNFVARVNMDYPVWKTCANTRRKSL